MSRGCVGEVGEPVIICLCVFPGCGCLDHVLAENILLLWRMEYTHRHAISALMAFPGLLRLVPTLNPIPHVLHKTSVWLSSFSKHIWDLNCPVCQQKGLKVDGGGIGDGTNWSACFMLAAGCSSHWHCAPPLNTLRGKRQITADLYTDLYICPVTAVTTSLLKDRGCNVSSMQI